jgi:DOPA 4,5-dioxygenase
MDKTLNIKHYHFHLYYLKNQINKAKEITQKIPSIFDVEVGRFWEKPVGPHPIGSCQITVQEKEFHQFLKWMMIGRGDIDVFIHPVTGDNWQDHTQCIMWLGDSHPLNIEFFK